MKNVPQGAATSVWAATSPRLDGIGGVYGEDADISPVLDEAETPADRPAHYPGVRSWAVDPVKAGQLWALSVLQTGLDLPA